MKSWRNFSRVVLNQDKGSTIEGPGRVDFFCGFGTNAEYTAGTLKEKGELYLLIKNNGKWLYFRIEIKNKFVKPLLNKCLQDTKNMREKRMFFIRHPLSLPEINRSTIRTKMQPFNRKVLE